MTRPWLLLAGLACFAGLIWLGRLRVDQLRQDPAVSLLERSDDADWIRPDLPFDLIAKRELKTSAIFVYRFETAERIRDGSIAIQAFRSFELFLDGKSIFRNDDMTRWKEWFRVPLPAELQPGAHVLAVAVQNHGGHPCLRLYSHELQIRTDPSWACTLDQRQLRKVLPVTATPAPEVALEFPTVGQSLLRISPVLAILFVGALYWLLRESIRGPDGMLRMEGALSPSRVRWGILAAWALLGINNLWQLPVQFGHDFSAHFEYIKFIATHHALPLATDGWQMFQSPLYYLVSAPLYALLSPVLADEQLVKILRVVPFLCGLAQVEVVYRCARVVFKGDDDLQRIATLVGGMLPMNVYMSQVIGNEPMAGLFTALVLLQVFHLLMEPDRSRRPWQYAGIGVVWGLALLSKVTPILLAPLILTAILYEGMSQKRLASATGKALLVIVACGMTAGWYFVRNWYYLGKPFAGGWDPITGNQWWQEPSYRTWDQMTSFGVALVRPVWSSSWSFWDSLYSTLWLDGSTSSLVAPPAGNVWNTSWLVAGAGLGLLPTCLLVASLVTLWLPSLKRARGSLLLSWLALGIYLAALLDLYLRLPIYSTAKASYTLGLLPCYALLIAAGAKPLLSNPLSRALVYAYLAVWAVAVYFAYFAFAWAA